MGKKKGGKAAPRDEDMDFLATLDTTGVDDSPDHEEQTGTGKTYKTFPEDTVVPGVLATDNSHFRLLGSWTANSTSMQTTVPTVPIGKLYEGTPMPIGLVKTYDDKRHKFRSNATEQDDLLVAGDRLECLRKAAEVHRQARRYLQSFVKPGMDTVEIVQRLEAKVMELLEADENLKSGWGFPTGVSLNECAAHYSPNYGETPVILKESDIMKVDFGVHVEGHIIDSAFTIAWDSKFDSLIEATQEGTKRGLDVAGPDAVFTDIGAAIEEVITSYEMEEKGKLLPILCVKNLHGHTIGPYKIHAGKSLPIVRNGDPTRMEEGELFAIETFASTGKGYVSDEGACSHYSLNPEAEGRPKPRLASARQLLAQLRDRFDTLPFCRRWIDDMGATRHLLPLKSLVDNEYVTDYPPLCDRKGCYTSQSEHTVLLKATGKEILSKGEDY